MFLPDWEIVRCAALYSSPASKASRSNPALLTCVRSIHSPDRCLALCSFHEPLKSYHLVVLSLSASRPQGLPHHAFPLSELTPFIQNEHMPRRLECPLLKGTASATDVPGTSLSQVLTVTRAAWIVWRSWIPQGSRLRSCMQSQRFHTA